MLKRRSSKSSLFHTPDLIRQILIGWLLAVTVEYLILPEELRDLSKLDGLAQMSLLRIAAITCCTAAILFALSSRYDTVKIERWSMVGILAVLISVVLRASYSAGFYAICLLILLISVIYALFGWNAEPEPAAQPQKAHKAYVLITALISIAFFLFVSIWTVARVRTFCSPTYDFGIFAQMFYNMKESGLPMTTVERDGLLSHFAVHFSPIYYLMLPFYCLFPKPETLQVLQAAVITSSVIPLWLIGKNHGLSGLQRTLLCALLLLYPAFSGGTSYDIHENCFLTPLILWLFYGIDRKNHIVTAIAAILTLMVKEDSAVYVAVISIYLILKTLLHYKKSSWKDLLVGGILLFISLKWFTTVTEYLASSGDGVMTYRYANFIYDDSSSLFTVVKAVIMNPMKAVYECMDAEKLPFIAQTLLPLLCLPLLTRRFERYLLLIPYILLNLMSDYQYQHDVFFQYTFGSTAFLFYLTAINLSQLKIDLHKVAALGTAVAISFASFSAVIIPTATYYPELDKEYREYYDGVRDALSHVPDGVSVSATTFYAPYLSQREILYDIRYASKEHVLETEYVVLKKDSAGDYKQYNSFGKENGYDNLIKLLKQNGYEEFYEHGTVLIIYKKA